MFMYGCENGHTRACVFVHALAEAFPFAYVEIYVIKCQYACVRAYKYREKQAN